MKTSGCVKTAAHVESNYQSRYWGVIIMIPNCSSYNQLTSVNKSKYCYVSVSTMIKMKHIKIVCGNISTKSNA